MVCAVIEIFFSHHRSNPIDDFDTQTVPIILLSIVEKAFFILSHRCLVVRYIPSRLYLFVIVVVI